jgi:hypothetical protein
MRALQLLALTSLACSGPLFSILKDGPEFFVNRRALPTDITLVAFGLFLVPALSILLVEGIVYLLGKRIGDLFHSAWVWLLSAVIALPLISSSTGWPGTTSAMLACGLGFIVAACAYRFYSAKQWLGALSLLSVVSLASFFFSDGVSTLLFLHKVVEGEGFTK